MNSIEEMNNDLSARLFKQLKESRNQIYEINFKYPEIEQAGNNALNFDIGAFREAVKTRLSTKLVAAWEAYQLKDEAEEYDMIYFEYNEQSYECKEAYSYGIYEMVDYKLTLSPHYYGFNYQFSAWEAGEGLNLAPFEISKPISYTSINNDEYFDRISYEDPISGFAEIWTYIHAICKYVFNQSFRSADQAHLFKALKIKRGGLFMYDIHDGGSVQDVFYIKE